MQLLHGISAPAGEGTILEVHLDIQRPTKTFTDWLMEMGFENDPFLIFFPPEYTYHMTGRARVLPRDMHVILPQVERLVRDVVARAQSLGISLYTETELARETTYFPGNQATTTNGILDVFQFDQSGRHGGAKADVHVEFKDGTVTPAVRKYLVEKHFYWVSTPPTEHFSSEEIATLQTTEYKGAKRIYDLLCDHPLHACTGIHLEQKLSMETTSAHLPMPEVIHVS